MLGYLISFSAGIASVISPCVLPLIPIVAGHSLLRKDSRQVLSFSGGFFLLFAIITILTVLFTAAINHYLFYFRILASIFLIILGLLLIFNPDIFKTGQFNRVDGDVSSSFVMGFITCLAWSPCFGPYLAVIAAYSVSTGDIFYSVVNMLMFSLGFSATLLVMAFAFSKIDLKKIIRYSLGIRIFSGFIIIIAGVYLLLNQLGIL